MNKITSINGTLMASLNELNEHVENGTAHVTEEERTAWNNQTTVNAKGILIATQGDLDEHAENRTIHLTAEERTAWNNKADASSLASKVNTTTFQTHTDNGTMHVTAEERETWNGKQDNLTDEDGNMTLSGGLTATTVGSANGAYITPMGTPIKIGAYVDNPTVADNDKRWFYISNHQGGLYLQTYGVVNGRTTALPLNLTRTHFIDGFSSAGGATIEGTINAGGGINIPTAVAPMATGAITNNELIDYTVDRVMRTSPYVTTVPAICLKDFVDTDKSTASLSYVAAQGVIRVREEGVANRELVVRFKPDGGIFPETQNGPHYYFKRVTVFSAPTLLAMSYLTAPGAVAQLSFVNDINESRYCGVRLMNKDGVAYYELFYKGPEDEKEVIAVSEAAPSYWGAYTGASGPKYKLQSLAVYHPGSSDNFSILKIGPWSMRVPWYLHDQDCLQLLTRNGPSGNIYYGSGLRVNLGSISHICLDRQDQFMPTLNNNAYQV